MLKKGNRGAIELSVGTIVVIVLAMSMLILGLVLVKTIFSGAKYNVEQMNEKVIGEINKLFVEDKKVVLFLSNRKAEIAQGKGWGIAFGIQNLISTQEFSWKFEVADSRIEEKCGVSAEEAENWIVTGGDGSVEIASGQKDQDFMTIMIPEGTVDDVSTCIIRLKLVIKKEDGTSYATESFDIDVR